MAKQGQKLLRVGAAAHELGLRPMTVRRWIKAGRIQVVQVGREIRIPRALLDHFIQMGQLPYKSPQWTLANDLDLADLQTQIYRQTGKLPLPHSDIFRDVPTSLTYSLYEERKNRGVKVSFAAQTPRSLTKVRLIYDTGLDSLFYRAHEHFSVRTILSILRGEIPYRNVIQLIEEAYIP